MCLGRNCGKDKFKFDDIGPEIIKNVLLDVTVENKLIFDKCIKNISKMTVKTSVHAFNNILCLEAG